jgi:hypothetical protein
MKATLMFLVLLSVLQTKAAIELQPGDSITHNGERISCEDKQSGRGGSAILTGERETYGWPSVKIKVAKPGANPVEDRWDFGSFEIAAKIADAFRKYQGPFKGEISVKMCFQIRQWSRADRRLDPSQPFILYNCLYRSNGQKTCAELESRILTAEACAAKM